MELRNPESKGYKRNNSQPSCPLPILNETDGFISFDDEYWPSFTGHFNGSSVIVDNPQEMLTLYSKGFFGKGSLSKGPPKIYSEKNVKCEVITERQWKRRRQWTDILLSKKRKDEETIEEDADVSSVKEIVKKSKVDNENVSEQIVKIDIDKNKIESDEKMDVDEPNIEENSKEVGGNVAKFTEDNIEEGVTTITTDRKVAENIEKDTESEVEKVGEQGTDSEVKKVLEMNSDVEIEKTMMTTEQKVAENIEKDTESEVEKVEEKGTDSEVKRVMEMNSDVENEEIEKTMTTERKVAENIEKDTESEEEKKMNSEEKKVIEINSETEHEEMRKTMITTDLKVDENIEEKTKSEVEKEKEKMNDYQVVNNEEKMVIEINSDTEHEEIRQTIITDEKMAENSGKKTKSEMVEEKEKKNDVNNEEKMVIEINSDTEQEKMEKTITTDRKMTENSSKETKSEVEKQEEKKNDYEVVNNEEKLVIEINSDTEQEKLTTTDRKMAENSGKETKSEVEKEKKNYNKVCNEEKMVIEINSDTENEKSSDKLYIIDENVVEIRDAEEGSREQTECEETKSEMKEINISLNTKQSEYTKNENLLGKNRVLFENKNSCNSKKSVEDRSLLEKKQVLVISDDKNDLTEDIITHLKPRIEIEPVKTVIEVLYLSLEEAFFLSYALNCLNVVGLDGKFLKMKDMWTLYIQSQSDFIQKYVAYHYFRAKGWVVKTGEKYAGDFVLYKKGPQHYHSSYVVHVRSEDRNEHSKIVQNKIQFTWDMLIGDNRLAETAKKEILFAYVMFPDVSKEKLKDPSILKDFQIREMLARRWLPSCVEIQEKKD